MGKKRSSKATLKVPNITGASSICSRDGKDSDASDLESLSFYSFGGDPDELIEPSNRDSLGQLFEKSRDKRIEVRIKATNSIMILLSKDFIPDEMDNFLMIAFEVIEKGLKRTQPEAINICSMVSLLTLQFGVEVEKYLCPIVAIMQTVCLDKSASDSLRSSCAHSLGICVSLGVEQFEAKNESLKVLKELWTSFKPNVPGSTELFSAALNSWVLILKKLPLSSISSVAEECLPKLCSYLESSTVEARISTGESLAVLHEFCSLDDYIDFSSIRSVLMDLSADSAKHRAKRDKKLQRISFRQIISTIFDGIAPKFEIEFNRNETLVIEGCYQKLFYDYLCQLLKGDINRQLTINSVLRELFDLGPVFVEEEDPKAAKKKKAEKMNRWVEEDKKRNVDRSKFRAMKRSDCAVFEEQ